LIYAPGRGCNKRKAQRWLGFYPLGGRPAGPIHATRYFDDSIPPPLHLRQNCPQKFSTPPGFTAQRPHGNANAAADQSHELLELRCAQKHTNDYDKASNEGDSECDADYQALQDRNIPERDLRCRYLLQLFYPGIGARF
jgi:hypothetical protein